MALRIVIAFAHQDAAARFKFGEIVFEPESFVVADAPDLKKEPLIPPVEPGKFGEDGEAGDNFTLFGPDSGAVEKTALLFAGMVPVVGEKEERGAVAVQQVDQLDGAGDGPRPVDQRAVDVETNGVEPDRFGLPEFNQSHHGFLTDTILLPGENTTSYTR